MKRWQDRGEVLDSDDEDLAESQSQERASKKPRVTENAYCFEKSRDNGITATITELPRTEERSEIRTGNQTLRLGEGLSQPRLAIANLDENNSKEAHVYGSLNQSGESYESQNDTEPVLIQSPHPTDERQLPLLEHNVPNPRASDSESLLEISKALDWNSGQTDDLRAHPGSDNASPQSSTLSEHDISPSPPPGTFRFPRLAPVAGDDVSQDYNDEDADSIQPQQTITTARATEISPDQDQDKDVLHPASGVSSPEISTAIARRGLRARKEKQLHPYLFDKAQHQKQFRERGIRPIQYHPDQQDTPPTQEGLFSENNNESDPNFTDEDVAREKPSSELGEDSGLNNAVQNSSVNFRRNGFESDEELPELTSLFRQPISSGTQHGMKRRKLFHRTPSARMESAGQSIRASVQNLDEFSILHSPPPTSSNSVAHGISRATIANFKMPRGLTPDPLPTPEISSELRDGFGSQGSADESETGRKSRRSLLSTASRSRARFIAPSSSPEPSEAEFGVNVDNRRLQRERKRIKGVLPASWLKIDFRAQQKQASPSPTRPRRQSSPSPMRTAPHKGVAQKVARKTLISPGRATTIPIFDEDTEEEWPERQRASPEMSQMELDSVRERGATAPSEFVDDERMEVDWIDPMITSSSRPRARQKNRIKRQPRITESFGTRLRGRTDFSEERKATRWLTDVTPARNPTDATRPKRKPPRRPAAPRLSVIDAPAQTTDATQRVPQFVRVAIRRARIQPGRGRHSPTNKHIRLATAEDTEDAASVLQSWREGTILPLQGSHDEDTTDHLPLPVDDASETEEINPRSAKSRPLMEIHHNQQKKLPAPLRKQRVDRRPPPYAHMAKGLSVRQTQLRPVKVVRHIGDQSISRSTAVEGGKQRARPLLVQTHPVRYRGAQLESLEGDLGQEHRAAAFERRMHCLTENIVRPSRDHGQDFQLARFLGVHSKVSEKEQRDHDHRAEINAGKHHKITEAGVDMITFPHRPRKHRAQRIDAEALEYRQPSEPLPGIVDLTRSEQEPSADSGLILHGLGDFGTRYATDFDILPLQLGTYFHESSFIGSGDFAASLNFASRNLDSPIGRIQVHLDGEVHEWGAWTEDVATALSRVPGAIANALESIDAAEESHPDLESLSLVLANVDYLLRSAVRYFTRCLAFLDPVDRRQCITSMHRLIEDLLEVLSEHDSKRTVLAEILSRSLHYILVLSRQQLGLCNHSLVPPEVSKSTSELFQKVANRLSIHVVSNLLPDLRSFYEKNRRVSNRQAGVRDTDTAVCSVVILHRVILDLGNMQNLFWSMIYGALGVDCSAINIVHELDVLWYDIFTLLPALEIDAGGILKPGSRFQDAREDWSLPKRLIQRLFELYPSTCVVPGSTINEYVRATLARCSHLMSRWGWWRCEPLLGTISDFFTHRSLAPLRREESGCSPRFLQEMHLRPALDIQAEDISFHIFLKMLAVGLQGMRKYGIYPDKKIGGIAWRFIPNHGRTHRKDMDLQQEDLNALRNHHDLLCTLYYAAPPGNRLRVNLLQNLVDHSVSHREASRLNIRAWAILSSFQVCVEEGDDHLEDLCSWYRDAVTTNITQYRLARSEVEHELSLARAEGKPEPSSNVVEDIIARNQRQVAATLVDMLAALKHTLQCCRNIQNVLHLLSGSLFWQVFDLFDPSTRRLYGMLHEALDTVQTASDLQHKFESDPESQPWSEDSQEYGDSAALQQYALEDTMLESLNTSVASILYTPLSHLVSDIFGADTTTDDALLTKLVNIWAHLAQRTVQTRQRTWSSYISDYKSDAWTQLRDTEQRRKYTPYFLARIVEIGNVDLDETGILTSWLRSLVDREAILKFQHLLTSSLLNRHPNEPLLANLPFSRLTRQRFDLSLQDLRQRRLGLISTVFSNMRESLANTARDHPDGAKELRQTYAVILRQLMQAMKNNYQELQASRTVEAADVLAEGAYVTFVQHVVSFLQQYATDICAVDRFFTDSAAFPLPATDPTYVVGRLRSYSPKLDESRKRVELAIFVQTVSERAAVDNQQTYLVDQLVSAVAGSMNHANTRVTSLRQVLCAAIFPAYLENALSTACSWILALPILETCGRIAAELLYDVKAEDSESLNTIGTIIGVLLQSAAHPVRVALAPVGRLSLPHVQATLSALLKFVRSCLTCMKFLEDVWQPALSSANILTWFYGHASSIEAHLTNTHEDEDLVMPSMDASFPSPWPETLDAVRKQLDAKFANEWYARDGQYYIRRGNQSQEVTVDLGGERKAQLLAAIREFRESYEVVFKGQKKAPSLGGNACNVGTVIV